MPSTAVDRNRWRLHTIERRRRGLYVVSRIRMCVNVGDSLQNLALLHMSSILTDVVDRHQRRSNVDADVRCVVFTA